MKLLSPIAIFASLFNFSPFQLESATVANAIKCEIINVCYADTGFCQTALSLLNVMEHPQVRETSTLKNVPHLSKHSK